MKKVIAPTDALSLMTGKKKFSQPHIAAAEQLNTTAEKKARDVAKIIKHWMKSDKQDDTEEDLYVKL